MADVFVSYAHTNAAEVRRITGGLEAAGYSLWWDQRLLAAADFGAQIEQEIAQSRCVVVAWSRAARDSLWVRAEAAEALEHGKLVQIRLDRHKPPLPYTMLHLVDLSGWNGDRSAAPWRTLESSVASTTRGETKPQAASPPAAAPGRQLAPLIAMGAASIGLVAIVATFTAFATTESTTQTAYGLLSKGAFLLAALALAHMMTRVIQIAFASRRA